MRVLVVLYSFLGGRVWAWSSVRRARTARRLIVVKVSLRITLEQSKGLPPETLYGYSPFLPHKSLVAARAFPRST